MRYQNIRRNALASYIGFSLSAALALLLSPLFVSFLGAASFGIWKACLRVLDFASVADGRASQGLKWILASKSGESDVAKRRAIGSALRVWKQFLPLTALVLICLVWFMPYLIRGGAAASEEVRMVAAILAVNMVLFPLLGIPDAALSGANEAYVSTNIQTGTLLASNLLMVWLAMHGYGLLGVVGVALLATIVNAVVIFMAARRRLPWFGIAGDISAAEQRHATRLSVWVLLWTLVSKFMLSVDFLLIAFFVGPDAVTKYVFNTYTTQLGLSVALITGSAAAPAIASLLAGRDPKAGDLIDNTQQGVLFIVTLFATMTLLLNRHFVALWVGPRFYLGDAATLAIVVSFVQLALLRNDSQIQDASLDLKRKVLVGLGTAVVTLVLGACAMLLFDASIEMLLVAVIISRIGMSLAYRRYVEQLRNRRAMFSARGCMLLLYGLAAYLLSSRLRIDGIPGFIAVAVLGSAVTMVVGYLCCFDARNRAAIRLRVTRLVGRP